MPKIPHEYFYKAAFEKYGVDPKALCWNDASSQRLRFEILLEALPKPLDSYSIVDAGCGLGDFYLFLQEKGVLPKRYIGIDSFEAFAAVAKRRTKQKIVCADVLHVALPKADYYVCSGALNTLSIFESLLFIKRCLDASSQGFIFNFLYGKKKSETYNYFDDALIETMLESFDAELFFSKKGYMQNDMTIGVRKRCAQSLV